MAGRNEGEIQPRARQGSRSSAAVEQCGQPTIYVELSGADLRRANLRRANLTDADLSYANLRRADLRRAYLACTSLFAAKLHDADLHGALSAYADLRHADLSGADLSGASLFRANLSGTDLSGADLSRTYLGETVFGDVDLSGVIGLKHAGTARQASLITAHCKIRPPLPFLRGIGLPDNLINYLPSLLSAIQHYPASSVTSKG